MNATLARNERRAVSVTLLRLALDQTRFAAAGVTVIFLTKHCQVHQGQNPDQGIGARYTNVCSRVLPDISGGQRRRQQFFLGR